MKKIILYVAIVLASCSCEENLNSGNELTLGEAVPVTLNLQVEPLLSPNAGTKAGALTRNAEGQRVIASDRSGAMLLELIEEPETPTTRATDDATIANYWVFQFDGTDWSSKLVKMTYYNTTYTSGTTTDFSLIPGANQRIVVIANTFDANFNSGWTLNDTNYRSLQGKFVNLTVDSSSTIPNPNSLLVLNGGNYYTPMSGTFTGTLVAAAAAQNITLKRNLAQITFKVRLGSDVPPYNWQAKLVGIPSRRYWMSDRTDVVPFPSEEYALNLSEKVITPNTTDYVTIYDALLLPVNRRGNMPGRTAKDRNHSPPAAATAIKLVGDGTTRHTYTIHLGANFADDYNLNPNTKYTYQVTLSDDPDNTDSRIDVPLQLNGIYAGMLTGELKDVGGGIWQYTKALYVDIEDASETSAWASDQEDYSGWAGSRTDGKANTWNLNTRSARVEFPAANHCFRKNPSYASFTDQTDPRYVWYLPAQDELIGAWITHEATKTVGESVNWSSSSQLDRPISVSFFGGWVVKDNPINRVRVRCVRQATP